jgi:hypothetical protein
MMLETLIDMGSTVSVAVAAAMLSRTVRVIAHESFAHPLLTSEIRFGEGGLRVDRLDATARRVAG